MYQFKNGSRHRVSAQIAGQVCAELAQDGKLTACNLVEISRPQNAPLHDEFEWNDSEAAERWREQQARVLIASIVYVDEQSNGANEPVRAYFNLRFSDPEYESIETIIRSRDKYAALMERALHELRAFREKYRILESLAPVFDAIDGFTKQNA